MNEGFSSDRPEPKIRIRAFASGHARTHDFVNDEENGTRMYAEFRSFAAIPNSVKEAAEWYEVRVDVVPNSYNLGVHHRYAQSDTAEHLSETIVTGTYVVISALEAFQAEAALDEYLKGLGNHMAEHERLAIAMSIRAGQMP